MKNINKWLTAATGVLLLTSCADFIETNDYVVSRPAGAEQYDYLNDYQPLKEYLDRSAHPGFKVSAALTASEFNKKEMLYALAQSNFDEIVAGNAMKMASCVDDRGNMNFSTVTAFVNAAADAGLTVYGHTLAWHSQQASKWLNGLMKDKELDIDPDAKIETYFSGYSYEDMPDGPFPHYPMGCEPPIVNGALHFEPTGDWSQFFIFPGGNNSLVEGDYLVRLYMTADKDASGVQLTVQNGWGGDAQNLTVAVPVVAGEKVYELNFPGIVGGNYDCILKPQTADAVLDVKKIEFYKLESPAIEVEQEVRVKTYEDGPFPFYPMGCEPPVINGAIHFEPTGDWSQFFCFPGGENPLEEGDYVFYLDLQADKAASGVQFTIQNGWGGTDQNLTVAVPVAEGRKLYKLNFPGVVGGNYDCILKPQTADAVLDLYSVTVCQVVKLNSIPLTPEEKKDTLTYAMNLWINNMMQATGGQVKAWDLVNEAISGGGNVDGYYALQHFNESSASTDFFWQDYLGDVDYVVTAEKAARSAYAAIEGTNPADLKLFINDYNLESTWDNNHKLESLIYWIGKWEEAGAKIDGIGSQMHISYYVDADSQAKQKAAITRMLELMAKTGKLVRISELDMGIYDRQFGNKIPTSEVTFEQLQAMADYYKWIIQEYFRVVPVAQQYGICQWCLTDAPASSGWRGGEPVGLWFENYTRKPAYAGWAEGLQTK